MSINKFSLVIHEVHFEKTIYPLLMSSPYPIAFIQNTDPQLENRCFAPHPESRIKYPVPPQAGFTLMIILILKRFACDSMKDQGNFWS